MPINDDAVIEYVEITGEQVPKIVVPAEVTITHTETGKEYGSEKEADDDVNDVATPTKREHIRRDVNLKVAAIDLGAVSGKL